MVKSSVICWFFLTVILVPFGMNAVLAQDNSNTPPIIEDVLTTFDVCGSLGVGQSAKNSEQVKKLQKENELLEFALNGSKNLAAERRTKLIQCETEKRLIQRELSEAKDSNEDSEKLQGYIKTTNALRSEIRELNKELTALKAANQASTPVNYSEVILSYKKRVQSLLNAKNCPAGKVDGIIGKKTVDAAQWFARSVKYYSFNGDIFEDRFYKQLVSSSVKCRGSAQNSGRKLSNSDRTALNGRWRLTATCDGGRVITATGVLKYAKNDAYSVRYDLVDYVNSLGNSAVGTAVHSEIGTSGEKLQATLWFKGGGTASADMKKISSNLLRGNDSNGCSLVARR